MKFAYTFLGIATIAAYLTNPLVGTIIAAFLAAGIWAVWIKVEHRLLLKRLSKRIDPVYIIGADENGDHPDLGNLGKFCIPARRKQVGKVAGKWRDLLRESNNQQDLEVVEHRYQDGEFVNETPGEYRERLISQISDHRSKHHLGLKQSNYEWYVGYHHGEFKTEPSKN